jgi:hypothetical protein
VPSNKDRNGLGGSDIVSQEIFPLLQHMPNFGNVVELEVNRFSIQCNARHDGHSTVKDPRE